MIRVLKPGVLTTVQDLGRPGYAHLGLSPAGAADSLSLRAANLLVGNPEDAAAVECTLLGPTLEFDAEATLAISGSASANGLPWNQTFTVAAGERLSLGALTSGARAYIAVRGGIDVAHVMDSASTFLPAAIGGYHGRALKTGDELPVGQHFAHAPRKLRPGHLPPTTEASPLRVLPAMQASWFGDDAYESFAHASYIVTDKSNRSGLRLSGDPIRALQQQELITEGIPLGGIQVPSDGQPIILFVDQQTTGGYPKIATVISADLPRIGQLRPRDEVKFHGTSLQQAWQILRDQERRFHEAFE